MRDAHTENIIVGVSDQEYNHRNRPKTVTPTILPTPYLRTSLPDSPLLQEMCGCSSSQARNFVRASVLVCSSSFSSARASFLVGELRSCFMVGRVVREWGSEREGGEEGHKMGQYESTTNYKRKTIETEKRANNSNN